MATPRDTDQQLLTEISNSAAVIRERSRRSYRDLELLRRLTAQHVALVEQLTDTSQEDDTSGNK